MADKVKRILAKLQLADQVIQAADEAYFFKQECSELKSRTSKLADLLRQAARSPYILERPTARILSDTERVLDKTLALALKCRSANGFLKRAFTLIPAAAFRKLLSMLENSIGDVSWLLRVSAPASEGGLDYLGLPPIAANEPILCLIWEQIALLHTGTLADRSDAAASLVSLARDNPRYGSLIIEEGGVCSAFAKILKEGPMEDQGMVAWAVSELAAHSPKCKDLLAQQNVVRLLVGHLPFETIQEHCKYAVAVNKASSMHQVVLATTKPDPKHPANEENERKTNLQMNAMAVRALWHLAKDSPAVCRSITESRALLCLAVLLEKGAEEIRSNSAMALMEITAVAAKDADLRRSAFKPNSPACKAVVDQLLKVIEKADSELLIPCIKAVGNLARTFTATRTRMIGPLVKLLDGEREPEVSREAAIALAKFAGLDNYLHIEHSKAIIDAGGVKHLIQLVYFGELMVQIPALVLICYIAGNVPESEELAENQVLFVLEWSSKQAHLIQDENREKLLLEAKSRVELYQSRGTTR